MGSAEGGDHDLKVAQAFWNHGKLLAAFVEGWGLARCLPAKDKEERESRV